MSTHSPAASAAVNPLLSADEVADYLLIPRSTVMKYQREGRIQSIRVGKHIRFLQADVDEFVVSLRSGERGR